MNSGEIESGVGIDPEVSIQLDASLQAVIDETVEIEVHAVIEQAVDEGIYEKSVGAVRCPQCHHLMDKDDRYCKNCNHAKDDLDSLIPEEDQEDREADDGSDNEDSDDYGYGEIDEEQDKLPFQKSPSSFAKRVGDFLTDREVPDDRIALYRYLIEGVLSAGEDLDAVLPEALLKDAVELTGKPAEDIQELWNRKPFSDGDIAEVIGEVLDDRDEERDPVGSQGLILEIVRVGNEYQPSITDPYENLIEASVKRRKKIQLGKVSLDSRLLLKKIKIRNDNLYRVLEFIILKRKRFLDAESKEAARRILKEDPFEQKELEEYGFGKWTISRYFSSKTVNTPHGIFLFDELTAPRARVKGGITLSRMRNQIRQIFEEGDAKGMFYSDREVAELLEERHAIVTKERNVRKIRVEHLKLPNQHQRKRAFRAKLKS